MRYVGITCLLLALFSCEHPLEPTQPTVISVAVSPSSAQVLVSENLQFNVSVEGTGDFDSMVAWYVNGIEGGNNTYGVISTDGLYTASETVPIGAQAIVQVVSIADTTKLDSAIVTIYSNITSVTITPQPDSIFVGYEEQFTATVYGTGNFPTDVIWSVHGIEDGSKRYIYIPGLGVILTEPDSERCGYIDQSGHYTAPPTVPFTGTIIRYGEAEEIVVSVVSATDPGKGDSVSFIITSGITRLGIKPVVIDYIIGSGDAVQFRPIFYGSPVDSTIIWFIVDPRGNGEEGGNEIVGTISSTGLYIGPSATTWSGASIHIKSAADLRRYANGAITFYLK